MKIEKLTENKIRITLNIEDLAEKNIDFHEFMSNPIDSQALFLDMLEQAEKEVGFVTRDCKIMLEALVTSAGTFILTVTRVAPELSPSSSTPKRKLKVKKKISSFTINKSAVFEFLTFDDFCDYGLSITTEMSSNINSSIKNSKLCLYEGKYYLVIDKLPSNKDFIKSFFSSILEFCTFISYSDTYKNKILEHGKIILGKNAIVSCIKKFNTQQ